jgi:hypothetical protein
MYTLTDFVHGAAVKHSNDVYQNCNIAFPADYTGLLWREGFCSTYWVHSDFYTRFWSHSVAGVSCQFASVRNKSDFMLTDQTLFKCHRYFLKRQLVEERKKCIACNILHLQVYTFNLVHF